MELKQGNFEGWAIVELMGHQVEIGFVVTEAFGQAVLFRIDTPALPEREFVLTAPEYASMNPDVVAREWCPPGTKVKRPASPGKSRLVAPGSLYAINPCTEEAARQALEKAVRRPLILIERPPQAAFALTAPGPEDIVEREDDDEHEADEQEGFGL